MIDEKLRDEMMILKGKIEALQFPIFEEKNNGIYDLIDSICKEYDHVLERLFK